MGLKEDYSKLKERLIVKDLALEETAPV